MIKYLRFLSDLLEGYRFPKINPKRILTIIRSLIDNTLDWVSPRFNGLYQQMQTTCVFLNVSFMAVRRFQFPTVIVFFILSNMNMSLAQESKDAINEINYDRTLNSVTQNDINRIYADVNGFVYSLEKYLFSNQDLGEMNLEQEWRIWSKFINENQEEFTAITNFCNESDCSEKLKLMMKNYNVNQVITNDVLYKFNIHRNQRYQILELISKISLIRDNIKDSTFVKELELQHSKEDNDLFKILLGMSDDKIIIMADHDILKLKSIVKKMDKTFNSLKQ